MASFTLPAMDSELPFDPAALRGRLANGLTYYVRQNKKPMARAELRLVVRAGSVLERDDERGVAHIVEHLAFRKTEKFDNFALVKFLESIGAKFGACQNAYTNLDQTVYELHVPIDKAGLLERSLEILQQFAFGVIIDDEALDAERTIVLEEWRQGKNASARASKSHFKDMLRPSAYEKRLPIGTRKSIMGVPTRTVKAFYKRWYHPHNMAVVCVGDLDRVQGAEAVLAKIRAIFDCEPWPNALHLKPVIECPVHSEVRLSVLPDDETTSHSVMVDCTRPRSFVRTAADYRRLIVDDIFHMALNVRFQKIMLQVDPPFVDAQSTNSVLVTAVETSGLSIVCHEGGALRALEAALVEVVRMRLHGCDGSELDMCKSDLLAELETQRLERDQWESDYHANRFVSHFVAGEPVLDAGFDVEFTTAVLGTITSADFVAAAANYSFPRNTVVKITRPAPPRGLAAIAKRLFGGGAAGAAGAVEDIAAVEAVVRRVEALQRSVDAGDHAALEAWVMPALPEELLATPEPGPTVAKQDMTGRHCGDVTEVTLSNGLTCCFRKTDFLDDEIRFSGVALGGLSEVPPADIIEARHATTIAAEVGVYGVVPEVWVDVMAGIRSTVWTSVSLYGRAVGGECSPVDLEFTMRCIHLLFTAKLHPDEARLRTALNVIVEAAQNRDRDPASVFHRRVVDINTGAAQAHFAPVTVEQAQRIDPHKAVDFFIRCFSDPAEFKFAFVGTLDVASAIQLAETYLGSIPTPGRAGPFLRAPQDRTVRYECSPVEWKFPSATVVESMRLRMVQPFGLAQLTFPVTIPCERKLEDTLWMSHVEQALERRLMERLRFNDSAVYSVSCSSDFESVPPNKGTDWRGMLYVYFTCDPSEARTLCASALEEVTLMLKTGPTQAEVAAVVETQVRTFQEAYETNSFWCSSYTTSYRSSRFAGRVVDTVDEMADARLRISDTMTTESLGDAIRRLVPSPQQHTLVTLGPQSRVLPAIGVAGVVAAVAAAGVIAFTVLRRR